MAPENASVFVLEDIEFVRDTIKEILEEEGHTVPLTASSKKEAMDAMQKFKKEKINVAVLDNNLDENDDYNHDGVLIAEEIRNKHPDVIIVGNSSKGIPGATYQNMGKSSFDLADLITRAK